MLMLHLLGWAFTVPFYAFGLLLGYGLGHLVFMVLNVWWWYQAIVLSGAITLPNLLIEAWPEGKNKDAFVMNVLHLLGAMTVGLLGYVILWLSRVAR